MNEVLLEVDALGLDVPNWVVKPAWRPAPMQTILRDVSLRLGRAGALGVIGESGSGKSSLARALTLLARPQRGRIVFEGQDVLSLSGQSLAAYRARLQLIFQDPMSSLNPRRKIGDSITAAPQALGRLGARQVRSCQAELLERVGLAATLADRYPHELSGGQRQRVGIARALALDPVALIADEVTSGLDVSAQARIVALLESLRRDMGLALIFISHDLSLVRSLCDEVLILRSGEVVEQGDAPRVFDHPQHPYTRRLLDAIPLPDPDPHWIDQHSGSPAM